MPDDAIERARECLIREGMHEDTDTATGLVPYAVVVRALLAFASQQAPEGWRLVPIVPTDAMIEAAGGACINLERADDPSYEPAEVWSAMLDAAPSVTLGEVG